MTALRSFAFVLPLVAALVAGSAHAEDAMSMSPSTGAWQFLPPQFYGGRDIGEVDEAYMSITAPASTPDPSATPVTLHFGRDAVGAIRKVRVIIDNNPVISLCTPVLRIPTLCCVRACRGIDPAGCGLITISPAPCISGPCQ